MNKRIILASSSPRRKELLEAMGLKFDVIPSSFDEQLDNNRPAGEVAIELARGKVHEIASRYPDCIVIGSDTIVTVAGKQLEKPRDTADAEALLRSLAGGHNDVATSIVVTCKQEDITLVGVDTTRVYFKPYDAGAMQAYIATGDPIDKAGAYGIQSGAAPLIDHIEGEYDTVIGLPTKLLAVLLGQLDIQVAPVEWPCPVRQITS